MYRPVILAAVAAGFFIAPAAAESGAEGSSDKDKVICKKVVKTGSVMPKRTCLTKAKWDAIQETSRNDLQRSLDQDRAKAMTSLSK